MRQGRIATAGPVVDIRLKDRSEKPTEGKITFVFQVIRRLAFVGKTRLWLSISKGGKKREREEKG